MRVGEKVIARAARGPVHGAFYRARPALPVEVVAVVDNWNAQILGDENRRQRDADISGIGIRIREIEETDVVLFNDRTEALAGAQHLGPQSPDQLVVARLAALELS